MFTYGWRITRLLTGPGASVGSSTDCNSLFGLAYCRCLRLSATGMMTTSYRNYACYSILANSRLYECKPNWISIQSDEHSEVVAISHGCGLSLDVSVLRPSWDVLTSRLGLVSVSAQKVSASRLGLGPLGHVETCCAGARLCIALVGLTENDGHEIDGHENDGHEIDGHENDGHEIGGQDIIVWKKIALQCSVQFFSKQRQNTSHSSEVSCIDLL